MNPENQIVIRREGKEIGKWNLFELRQRVVDGTILLSDEFLDEEQNEWITLLPRYRRRWNFFDWSMEDDFQWYYIRDGYIYGPRSGGEIESLYESGFLSEETLVSLVMAKQWISLGELFSMREDGHGFDVKDYVSEAVNSYRSGDLLGAGIAGFKAAGKLLEGVLAPSSITDSWLCVIYDSNKYPDIGEAVEFVGRCGAAVQEYMIIDSDEGELLAMRFLDKNEATEVKLWLSSAVMENGFRFRFVAYEGCS